MKKTLALALSLAAILSLVLAEDDIFLGEKHKPGFVNFQNGDDMFYWLFESRASPQTDPLTIWLTGGPGCSSQLAIFYENGPFKIKDDLTLQKNQFSWNNNSNLLFVDQPVGTGFSKVASPTHYKTSESGVATDMYTFIVGFLEQNPQYKGRDLYITGESYAGHYVPAIASYYVKQKNPDIVLKAVAIGNGWTDPYDQYPAYNTFSHENKLISDWYHYALDAGFTTCQGLILAHTGIVALEACQLMSQSILGNPLSPSFNVYDIRKKCDVPPLCYDFSLMDKFIAREDVREILGVGKRSWSDCNMTVHTFMLDDWLLNLQPNVIELLDSKVDVLVYSGDKDWICNWRGGQAWTHRLEWSGKDAFNKLDYSAWNVNGEESGQVKTVEGLTFLRVYEAGHMVPMDQPQNAAQMLKDYMYKK